MLSFRTMFDAERSKGMTARIGFRLGGEDFLATIENGIFQAARGEPDDADAVFTGSAATLAAAVYGGQPVDALAQAGALEPTGDRPLAAPQGKSVASGTGVSVGVTIAVGWR